MSSSLIDIDKLTAEQRLQLIEELWDSLEELNSAVPLTDAQRNELDRRLDELDGDGPVGIPWDEVLLQIHRRT